MMDMKDKLLEMLICPQCKKSLIVEDTGAICPNCRVLYPFSHGVPAMMADSAIPLDAENSDSDN